MPPKPPRPLPRAPQAPRPEADDSVALRHEPGTRPPASSGKLRVIKTIAPGERGAKALAAVYGEQLVCIRHRLDPSGRVRLTTVEVVISATRLQWRPSPTVAVVLPFDAHALRQRVVAAGGRWDPIAKVWRLRRATAMALGLRQRIRE